METIKPNFVELTSEYFNGGSGDMVNLRDVAKFTEHLFEKFTLLKETPTVATDNTLPPSEVVTDKGVETAEQCYLRVLYTDRGIPPDSPLANKWMGDFRKSLEYSDTIRAMQEYSAQEKVKARRGIIDFLKSNYEGDYAFKGNVVISFEELGKLKNS